MGILNNSEEDKIKSAISSGDIVISTVARLYKAVSGSWDYTSKWGGIVLVKEDKAHFLKIVNLDNSNVEWTQELYDGFNYEKSKPFLHVFEGDDAVYGLSFADESDANSFHSKVSAAAPGSSSSSSSTRQPPSRAPPLNLNPRGPPAALSPSTSPRSTHSPAEESNSSPAAVDSPSADDAPAKTKKTKRGFGGFMGTVRKYKGKITGEEKEDIEVSKPRDFRHLSSIGWTPENGFEIRNIPPEWRKLFQQAGVKKSELQDAETAAFVMDIIQKEGGFETLAAEAEKNESNDNSNANEDAPTTTAPSAPPAPPPMPNAPAPPPMPAGRIAGKAAGGGGAPRGGLLDQIKQGKELQKVEPPAESAPAPTAGLADTLAKAMAARRGNMMQGPSKSNVLADDSDDDSWED